MTRTVLVMLLFIAALRGGEVSDKEAYVQSKELSDGDKTLTVKVRVRKPGTYLVVAGHVIDHDTKFRFVRGDKSKIKYYEIKEVRATADGVAEVAFKLKPAPPVPPLMKKTMLRVAIYPDEKSIPVYPPEPTK